MSTTRETSIRWTAASIFQSSILGSQIESHLSVQNEPSPGFVFLHSSVGVLGLNHTLGVKDAICFYTSYFKIKFTHHKMMAMRQKAL
jgi:hypothetical protein